jgi:predicted esterase
MTGYGRFGWRDNEQAAGEIRDHLRELGARYPLDPARLVLGGFSQGGWVAVEMALRGDIPAAGIIAVAPGTPLPDRWDDLVVTSTAKHTRFVLIIGDQDVRFFPQTQALDDLLRSNGFTSDLRVFAGLDHAYPPDFETLLSDVLRFVTEKS